MSDWSCGLLGDVLASILQRFSLEDCIRSGAVCTTWRSLVVERGYPPSKLPWLLLPRSQSDELKESHNFYSLSDKQEYKIHLPGVQLSKCIGASEGWLIIHDEGFEVSLLNPLTRAQIQLPPFPKALCGINLGLMVYMNAAMSWSSASSYTVVVLRNPSPTLAFTRAGDEAWTVLEKEDNIQDLVHHKGLFYIQSSNITEALELTGPSPRFTQVAGDWRNPNDRVPTHVTFQLADSSGDLFQFVRKFNVGHGCLKTSGFNVFNLDPSGPKWTKAQTLGDQALFLGHSLSMFIPAHDFPGLKGSCIYFDEELWQQYLGATDMIPYLRVFDLEDECVKTYCPHERHLTSPIPIWFMPNLS